MTTLITNGTVQELRYATESKRGEHDAFRVIVEERYAALTIASLKLGKDRKQNRRMIVGAYAESIKQIKKLHKEIERTFDAVVMAFVWMGEDLNMYQRLLKDERTKLPELPLDISDAMFAEVMVLPDEEILRVVQDAVHETVDMLIESMRRLLDMLSGQVIGAIEWCSTDVCKYHFFRIRRSDRHTRTEYESRIDRRIVNETFQAWEEWQIVTERKFTGTFDTLERHEHQLYNAARYRCPATQVRKPRFVYKFLSEVPAWLQSHFFVIEGDMLREEIDLSEQLVKERHQDREVSRSLVRAGQLYSPAITLGSYVLLGWSGRDL